VTFSAAVHNAILEINEPEGPQIEEIADRRGICNTREEGE
jgi:hypothetical protein